MATRNKAISAYIPPDIEEYLTEYCTEYDITRKDKSGEIKPALGTAVVEILKVFFSSDNVQAPLPSNVPLLPSNVVTEDRLSQVLSELELSSNVSSKLPSNVITEEKLSEFLGSNPNTLPDNVPTKDDLSELLSKVPGIVDERVGTAVTEVAAPLIAQCLASEIASLESSLREELALFSECRKGNERASGKAKCLVSQLESEKARQPEQDEEIVTPEAVGDEEEIKLTRDEAWEIAVERGFTGSKPKSLTDGISRKGNAEKYKAKYGLIRVGSGSKAYYFDVWRDNRKQHQDNPKITPR